MRKIKRAISAVTVLLLSVGIFTSCSSDKADSPQTEYYAQTTIPMAEEATVQNNYNAETDAENRYTDNGAYPQEVKSEDFNTEEYNAIQENGFKSVSENPLSTFSADVDTASYANLRRMITDGYGINPDAIRIEEMINYFSYDYPEPKNDEPFSVTAEISDCPWNSESQLMMIGMKTKDIDLSKREPMNLVFLIDVSGSMYEDSKLPLVQKSFSMLAENLTENDRISIVTYAGCDEVVLKGGTGAQRDEIIEAIESLSAGGSTAGADGIKTAYKIAEKYFIESGNNRVILATDGDLNVGVSSESGLTKLIEEERESGVFLSVLGFGTGNIKDNKMEALADNGNGNYSYIDSEIEAKKVLVEEMGGTLVTVAKDVKFQVEFNPANVSSYRLVGYENRALADKDFNDDTKDAGEIGAGHSVTVLYEIIPAKSRYNPDLKYKNGEGNTEETSTVASEYSDELFTVSVRYKEPDGSESKLCTYPITKSAYSKAMSKDFTFASSVAQFGMVLRNSEYKGSATCESILETLGNYDYSEDDYKEEFIYLVDTMANQGY